MRLLVTAAALSFSFVLPPAPAHAQTAGVTDAAGDVWNADKRTAVWWNPDISGVRVAYTRSRVVATVGFHRLRPQAYDVLEVRISTDADRAVEYRFADQRASGDSGVFGGPSSGRRVCDAHVGFDPARDVVRISAARTCFGNPRRVSAQALFSEQVWDNRMTDVTRWTAPVRRG